MLLLHIKDILLWDNRKSSAIMGLWSTIQSIIRSKSDQAKAFQHLTNCEYTQQHIIHKSSYLNHKKGRFFRSLQKIPYNGWIMRLHDPIPKLCVAIHPSKPPSWQNIVCQCRPKPFQNVFCYDSIMVKIWLGLGKDEGWVKKLQVMSFFKSRLLIIYWAE